MLEMARNVEVAGNFFKIIFSVLEVSRVLMLKEQRFFRI